MLVSPKQWLLLKWCLAKCWCPQNNGY